jgi:hypothetical protein
MTSDEFRELIAANDDATLLGPVLRENLVPYVFDPDPPTWDAFRGGRVAAFGVAVDDITVVGSGRFGFSMRPDANLRAFTDQSDIDVIVVNARLFDQLWINLLRAAYPRPPVTSQVGPTPIRPGRDSAPTKGPCRPYSELEGGSSVRARRR